MIPYGFGDPITSFENPYRQTDPNTPHLTIGHTPRSTSSRAFAFPSRGHRVMTSTTHLGRWKGGNCFYTFLLFTKNCDLVHGLDHGHALGHDHGPVLGVVALVDLGRTFGWTYDAPKVALPHLRRLWSLYWCA